ncbi:MAG: bacteriophage holin [Nanoarchaeota archaeon]
MALDPKNSGLACGIFWGVMLFVLTLISVPTGYAATLLNVMMSIYPGYDITYLGSIVGLIYGFIDGFVGLYILIWIYNKLEEKLS